jgi:hypothetical protein
MAFRGIPLSMDTALMDRVFDVTDFSFLVSSSHPHLTGLLQVRPIFHLRRRSDPRGELRYATFVPFSYRVSLTGIPFSEISRFFQVVPTRFGVTLP